MQNRLLVLVALAIVTGVTCGCLTPAAPESPPGPAVSPAPSIAAPLMIQINATPPRYSPVMSSTIGIRLTPVNTSGIIPSDARFTWETTFGSFYHWGPPDFKVTELGPRYTGTSEPVYWSFFSEQGEKGKIPVTVTVTVTDPSTGAVLSGAFLRISWEDPNRLTAMVVGSE
jgi:hypothetical protein